jgi:hypothetical protein
MALPKLQQPTYELTLPSTGKKLKYRPFTVKERAILLHALQDGSHESILNAIDELFKVCTFGKADLQTYPIVDSEWLFIHIRNKSVGEDLDVVQTCACEHENQIHLSLSDVQVVGENISKDINLNNGIFLRMKYPTMALASILSENPTEDELMTIIIKSIDMVIEGETIHKAEDSSEEEMKEFVLGLTQPQLTLVEDFFGALPKVVLEHKYNCSKCGVEHDIKLEGLENFFG